MCDVRLPNGMWVATIKKGGFFGEMALLKGRHLIVCSRMPFAQGPTTPRGIPRHNADLEPPRSSTRRGASIKSITYCQLFRLDKIDFDRIMGEYPELIRSMEASIRRQPAPPRTWAERRQEGGTPASSPALRRAPRHRGCPVP
eukprot:gene15580-biopygen2417